MTGFVVQGHIWWFAAQEKCLIIISVENSFAFFLGRGGIFVKAKFLAAQLMNRKSKTTAFLWNRNLLYQCKSLYCNSWSI